MWHKLHRRSGPQILHKQFQRSPKIVIRSRNGELNNLILRTLLRDDNLFKQPMAWCWRTIQSHQKNVSPLILLAVGFFGWRALYLITEFGPVELIARNTTKQFHFGISSTAALPWFSNLDHSTAFSCPTAPNLWNIEGRLGQTTATAAKHNRKQ